MQIYWDMLRFSSITHGALVGWATAAAVDFAAFRSWRNFNELYTYDWKIAAWRWLQGAVVGAISNSALQALL